MKPFKYFIHYSVLMLIMFLSGCFQTSQLDVEKKLDTAQDQHNNENAITNFLSYKKVDLGSITKNYQNIESIKVKDSIGRNYVYIDKESLTKTKQLRIASKSDFLEISISLKDGETVSLLTRGK